MGQGIGSVLTALLQGSAEGFVEAETEDKLKQEQEKTAIKQRRFDLAKLIFADPAATPEAKQLSLQVIGGTGTGKVATAFDQFVALGSMTQEVPGRTAPALPQGQAQAPEIATTQEGKIARGQPEVFQDEAPAGPANLAPVPLEQFQAPAETGPTQEALEREVIIEPTTEEIPLFKSAETIAREQGNLDLIRKTAVLNDAERRKAVTAEKKAIREAKALRRSVEAAMGEGQNADLVLNLMLAGMTAEQAFQQGGMDKKPTRVQRRTFTRAALDQAFFGLFTIEEATSNIPDSNLFSETEIKGLRDEALLRRKNAMRVADGNTLTAREAGQIWNRALGAAKVLKKRDPNEIIATFIPYAGVELQEQINNEILKRGGEPSQVRDLVGRPFENIPDLSGQLSPQAQKAIEEGRAEALPEFRPVPAPGGVGTKLRRDSQNDRDLAIELFKKQIGK